MWINQSCDARIEQHPVGQDLVHIGAYGILRDFIFRIQNGQGGSVLPIVDHNVCGIVDFCSAAQGEIILSNNSKAVDWQACLQPIGHSFLAQGCHIEREG